MKEKFQYLRKLEIKGPEYKRTILILYCAHKILTALRTEENNGGSAEYSLFSEERDLL
jgi:hypothetical protein